MGKSSDQGMIRDILRDLDRQISITEEEMHDLQIRYRQLRINALWKIAICIR